MRAALLLLGALPLVAGGPLTVPERTAHRRTSTLAEVRTFMGALRKAHPVLVPYAPKDAPGTTEAGKPLLAWRLPATGPHPLRVYVNANIHAGEVEGKEAVQVLLRELLEGRHPALRRALDLVVCPAYNADGTDALDPANRRHQPNPEESGVGRRENARGLDLNRDLMKAQAAETRWFLAMLRDFDPHVVFDLHTTNGSYHGFPLTYAPALALGADQGLLDLNRRMLVEVRERLAKEGLPVFDYGNFIPEYPKPGEAPTGWETFDARPRYLTNYPILQDRLAVLSEAYVYRSFPDRIQDTRRFVLATLDWLAAHREAVASAESGARSRRPAALPLAAKLKEAERFPFDVVEPIKDADGKVLGEASRRRMELPAYTAWAPEAAVPLPAGYLVDPAYAFRVEPVLKAHGVAYRRGAPAGLPLLHFRETGRKVAAQAFQGVLTLELQGEWAAEPPARPKLQRWEPEDLARALYVPLGEGQDPRMVRVAFYLLDPRSPDGLVQWGFFHETLLRSDQAWGEPPRFPILAVGAAGNGAASLPAPFRRAE